MYLCDMTEREDNGQFKKGHRKIGGKQKGYESPMKKEFRVLLSDFCFSNFEDFKKALLECEPKDYCRFYLDMVKYIIPTLQSITLDNESGITNDFTQKLIELSGKQED